MENLILRKWRRADLRVSQFNSQLDMTRWYQLLQKFHLNQQIKFYQRKRNEFQRLLEEAKVF